MTLEHEQKVSNRRNVPRFFVEHPHISWMLLVGVLVWGWFGYTSMPQRKDPDIPVRLGVAACPWPGATAQQVEQYITRRIEDVAAENKTIHPGTDADYGIKSISLPGYSFVTIQLDEGITDTKRQFSDINLKLNALNSQLPQGAGPISFQSDFGDTAALMLTVASPKADDIEIAARANSVEAAIRKVRDAKPQNRKGQLVAVAVVYSFPQSISAREVLDAVYLFQEQAQSAGIIRDSQIVQGSGFILMDGVSEAEDSSIQAFIQRFVSERLKRSELHPDAWAPAIIRDPRETRTKLASVAGDKYSYAELDDFSDLIGRTLLGAREVSKVERRGVLSQTVYLDYSQDRLAAYGLRPDDLSKVISARNIIAPGGSVETTERRITLIPSGQFHTPSSIGEVAVSATPEGAPVYLRDLVQISRGYQAPAQYLNYYTRRDKNGQWQRSRAITLAIYMRDRKQIARFGQSVNSKLSDLRQIVPADLILAHTSDQPLQVYENIHLFMRALIEAIILVVIVSLLGFWEWRLALIMALAIPITLAMTFGIVYMLGIDLQQVSIASLIIALGLLVDVPVVSGDGIKRHLAEGFPRMIACWLGPTKLATAIFYATITNVIAYLPFLMLTGNTGEFLKSLPVVMTTSLLCALVVSMTFVPFLGYYILRAPAKREPTIEERRQQGFYGFYNRLVGRAIKHRWAVLAGSLVFLIPGMLFGSRLKTQFFPEDVQYWFYLDVWLPNDTPLTVTNDAAMHAESVVRQVIENSSDITTKEHRGHLLKSLTTFAGGGGPRFWFSVSPEMPQTNYAQMIVEITDKEASPKLARPIQDALDKEVPGAWITVRQLQTNPVENPVELLISGQEDVDAKNEVSDIRTLRQLAGQAQDIVRQAHGIAVLRDDWFPDNVQQRIQIDPDRANVAGITNADVANASATAMSGNPVGVFKEGDKNIPIVARLRMEERSQLADIKNLYVYSSQTNNRVPLLSIATVGNSLETSRIARREHFRTISILCYPQPGVLASEVLEQILPKVQEFQKNLPPGYQLRIGGERAKQIEGFDNLKIVLMISLLGIYLALLVQFNNAVKPLLVFAAAPYGVVGSLIALSIMHTPFGFMAFLGIASLIGVIVSHVIVLFDFIEEMHEKGEPLEQALPDAGIQRIRPVMITVLATIFALFPLALEGGPLWQPLCYAQIGGLAVATFITLLLVPVLYSICVLDLKVIRWESKEHNVETEPRVTTELASHTS
jgi:multidrug efflux pump subunit AcrB